MPNELWLEFQLARDLSLKAAHKAGSLQRLATELGLSRHQIPTARHSRNYIHKSTIMPILRYLEISPHSLPFHSKSHLIQVGKWKTAPRAIHKDTKRCPGPLHRGQPLPLSEFYSSPAGYRSHCKHCQAHAKQLEVYYPLSQIEFAIIELVNRLGKSEAARRIQVENKMITKWLNHRSRFVRRATARRILLALVEARASDQRRHRASIHNGSYLRGIPERSVTEVTHLYRPHGDVDAERRARSRERLSS